MKIVSTIGFIVNTTKYGENSKILNILTKEYGLIGVIAKGVMSPKSKNRIVSERFTYAKFNIYYKENKLCTLINADIIDYYRNIKSDITLISYLTYLTELTHNVYKQNPDDCIFDLFISAIDKIENKFNPTIITNIIETKYLDYLGVGLNLNSCAVCGNNNIIALSHKEGGYICKDCYDTHGITNINSIKMIKLYYYVDIEKIKELNIKKDTVKDIDDFLYSYYRDYTGLYIKSKEFLSKLKA